MDPCIVPSGNSLLHLRSQIMSTGRPFCLNPPLVVEFQVAVPGARQRSCIFSFPFLPTTMPHRHWLWAVEEMILIAAGNIAAGNIAPALDFDQLVLDFCTYTHPAFVRFLAIPGRVLFLSAVVEVATEPPPRLFYYFPCPRAALHVAECDLYSRTPGGYRSDGDTSASVSPIRSTIKRVVYEGEAAAEVDRDTSCAVCLEEYEAAEVLDELLCRHRFHPCCVGKWLRKQPTCPVCRTPVPFDQESKDPREMVYFIV